MFEWIIEHWWIGIIIYIIALVFHKEGATKLILLLLLPFLGCDSPTKVYRINEPVSCSVLDNDSGALIYCTDGTESQITNGNSCTINDNDLGALVKCGNTETQIYNGERGLDGKDGRDGEQGPPGNDAPPTQYTITEIIDPCGDNPNEYDEIIIKMYNGLYFAYFEDKNKRFLTILNPGKYITTDKQKCEFEILENGEIIYAN